MTLSPDRPAAAPLTLAFDTSGPWVAVALARGGQVLAARAEAMARGQAERLLPLIGELCPDLSQLGAVACGIGPGNLTGVRIAVAAARGLALALRIPALGVSLFEGVALDAPRPVLVVLDARRGAFYAQRLGAGARPPWLAAAGEALPLAGCAAVLADPGALASLRATGPAAAGAPGPGAAAQAAPALLPLPPPEVLAANIARIAATRLPAGPAERAPRARPADRPPAPLYLRPADAAPPREPPPAILP